MKMTMRAISLFLILPVLFTILPLVSAEGENTVSADTFTDVQESAWYYDYVDYVATRGIMNGTGRNRFSPEELTTRAMFVTVLYRISGSPAVEQAAEFQDVSSGEWYSDAVAWAAEKEIVGGYGNGRFGPEDIVTREQAATILCRFAARQGHDVSQHEGIEMFSDYKSISSWAAESVAWATAVGIINGSADGVMSIMKPANGASRAELAAILTRWLMQNDPSHTHVYDTERVVDATCTKGGCTKHICACGASFADNLTDPLGRRHSFVPYVTSATPYRNSHTTFRCIECGYFYYDNYGSSYDAETASTKSGREKLAREEAARIVSRIITPDMNEREKARAICDWLHNNVGTQHNQSTEAYKTNYGNEAFAAFYFRLAACSGFCKAVTMMCDIAGLKSQHINPNTWSHQWNKVYCDGEWIILDSQGGIFGWTYHPYEDEFSKSEGPAFAQELQDFINDYLRELGFTGEIEGTILEDGKCYCYGTYSVSSKEKLKEDMKETIDHWMYDCGLIFGVHEGSPAAVEITYDVFGYFYMRYGE